MTDKIKPVSTALVPLKKPLDSSPAPETPPEIVESPPVEQISFWQYPHLFTGFRNSFLPLQENLDKFVSWQRERLQSPQEINFRNAVKIDTEIRGRVEDLNFIVSTI